MKIPAIATIENLRRLRAAISALESANTKICYAQTMARAAGIETTDIAAVVQREMKIASDIFRAAYKLEQAELDEDGAEYLHNAVWC